LLWCEPGSDLDQGAAEAGPYGVIRGDSCNEQVFGSPVSDVTGTLTGHRLGMVDFV
jgi:hypothetical protein